MKANELSCKDIMVGDWVVPYVFDSKLEPSKIVGIHYNSYPGRDYVDWVDCESWDELSLNDIEPIPLTPEILEKNGFRIIFESELHVSYFQDIERFHTEVDVDKIGIYQKLSMLDGLGNGVTIVECKYVHQLQHALRLCGITREIIL